MRRPLIVTSTDGVGTKTEIARRLNRYDTIGQDLVAMCADDVVCHGAQPTYFLDYIAVGKVDEDRVSALIGGVAQGVRRDRLRARRRRDRGAPGRHGRRRVRPRRLLRRFRGAGLPDRPEQSRVRATPSSVWPAPGSIRTATRSSASSSTKASCRSTDELLDAHPAVFAGGPRSDATLRAKRASGSAASPTSPAAASNATFRERCLTRWRRAFGRRRGASRRSSTRSRARRA